MPSLITPGSFVWHEFQSHIPIFVRIIKALKRIIIFRKKGRDKKKQHIKTRYSVKILNSTPKSPNNLFIYLKEETSHIPQNWKVYEIIIVVSPESLTGWQGWKLP